jgi:hypothetical protein
MATTFSNSYLIAGAHEGCYLGQQDRIDELNQRTYARNLPTSVTNSREGMARLYCPKPPLAPITTRCRFMPTYDHRPLAKPAYETGPWYGHFVDVESDLLNTGRRLGDDQNRYVPSGRDPSESYQSSTPFDTQHTPYLFETYQYQSTPLSPHVQSSSPSQPYAFHSQTRLDVKKRIA